ncbi:MAG: helix-turn-helix transcriptional regulator [Patescibacteria group bacterium]
MLVVRYSLASYCLSEMAKLKMYDEAEFTKFRQAIGTRVQAVRKSKGFTQEKLADITGLDRVAIGYIEQGFRAPRLKSLFIIARALECEVRDFIPHK